ncbi:protocatechuate 3,4-dioxygenase subunit alpha [Roseomonas sp. PWR1]|uniref:Protocatechuate 3,4-dioxygenase subunit alpha n=1 Tax=Roseomonas nitratireducens TaxID=2820810 RepID=A0ABS4ARM6_9PROT|nr:protocatechuate 3,4-dioxygenase subunit alpha [Neoroseomonas nitratireducens]MBP0464020.1 protocatechuate 3,4-dioxygenase subunit alpha [Neoroseomonas nitratireducens]
MTGASAPGAPLPPTSQHTIGPFFPRTFFQPGDNDLTIVAHGAAPTRRGEVILLRGTVTRAEGLPCVNQILEAWQADAGGRFNHPLDPERHLADPDFLGWGRAWTDAEGQYEFRTVLPGGYAEAGGHRAPHMNITVMGAGLMRRALTTVFFPDFAAENAVDPVLTIVAPSQRARLLAVPDGMADGVRVFRFDIRLRGDAEEETPFFED